jgi:hypothetical protein
MNSLYTFEESYLIKRKKKKEKIDSTLAPVVSYSSECSFTLFYSLFFLLRLMV